MLSLSNWRPDLPLADPFCGSGTILIEAVRKALCMAPGLGRNFAAEAWPQMPADCWRQAREEALSAIRVAPDLRVEGYDIDPDVLSMARYHAKLAGVEEHIHFQCRDIRDFRSAKKYGAIITNPAYGERMGDAGEAARLYGIMGRALAPLDTWSFYVLSAHPSFEEAFGRPAAKRTKLFNGKLECRLYQYHGPRPPRRELVENGARRI
jgi:putative N6-adenine-specific DNA methylase